MLQYIGSNVKGKVTFYYIIELHTHTQSGVHIQGIAGYPEATQYPKRGSCSVHCIVSLCSVLYCTYPEVFVHQNEERLFQIYKLLIKLS